MLNTVKGLWIIWIMTSKTSAVSTAKTKRVKYKGCMPWTAYSAATGLLRVKIQGLSSKQEHFISVTS